MTLLGGIISVLLAVVALMLASAVLLAAYTWLASERRGK